MARMNRNLHELSANLPTSVSHGVNLTRLVDFARRCRSGRSVKASWSFVFKGLHKPAPFSLSAVIIYLLVRLMQNVYED